MIESENKPLTFRSFIAFTTPTIIMMVFLSLYTIIDGIFVSRFVGQSALSAVNITLPLMTFTWGSAIMFATGGNAILAKKLEKPKQPKQSKTLLSSSYFLPSLESF